MGLLEYIPWKVWITFLIVVLVVMWAVWGGRRDYEIIGLRGISDSPFSEPINSHIYGGINRSHRYSQQLNPHHRSREAEAVLTLSTPRLDVSFDSEGVFEAEASEELSSDHRRVLRSVSPASGARNLDIPPPYSTLTPQLSLDLHLPSFQQSQVVNVRTPSPRPVVQIEQQVRLKTFVNPNVARKVSMGEELTIKALEALLGRQVQSQVRPFFLRNPETGRPLELDCYDPVSRIAVEYSGRQHYEFPSSFFTNEQDFYNQVYRDQLKRDLCDKNGIYLITVPYLIDMCIDQNCLISVPREIRYERIYNYLKDQLALYKNSQSS
jgi:hypothetical protein